MPTPAISKPFAPQQLTLLFGVLATGMLLAVLLWAKAASYERLEALLRQIELRKGYEELVFEAGVDLLEMQAARRAYVLTGDAAALGKFDAAAKALRARVAGIDRSEAQAFDAQAKPKWDAVQQQLIDYETHLLASVALRRDSPHDSAAQQQLTRQGERLAEPIYAGLSALERHVENRFDAEMKALLSGSAQLQRRDAWLTVIGLLGLFGAGALALREARAHGRVQAALAEANAALEDKVQSRTAALKDSAQRYRQLVELSADALLVCDADRRIVFANDAAARLLRASDARALIDVDVASLFALDDMPWLPDWIELLWKAPTRQGYRSATLRTLDGTFVAAQIGAASYDARGRMQAQIVVQDMSLLMQEQAAAREQLQFIDRLLEAIPAPLAVRDGQGRYLRINRAYEQMHRCDAAAVRNRSVFDVLPYAQAQQVAKQDAEAIRCDATLTYQSLGAPTGPNAHDLQSHVSAVRRSDGSLLGVITVETDVTVLRQKDRELERINHELEALSQRLIRAQEDERRRIARDLHDDVGQLLTLLKMSLQTCAAESPAQAQTLQRALGLTEDALQHARRITASLYPHGLEDLGLEVAVRHLVDQYVAGVIDRVEVRIALQPSRSEGIREMAAFRLIQEACTNVVKHAGAARLLIDVEASNGRLLIAVTDDGEGFDAGSTSFDRQQKGTLGIASMRERMAEIGGEFGIESTPGGGTSVRALLPW